MDEKDQKIADLTAQLEAANKAKEDSAAQLTQAGEVVQDLKKQLAEKPSADQGAVFGTVSVGKIDYELTVPSFNYLGEIITLDVLNQKAKLAETLVKDGVSFLRKAE